MKHDVIRYVRQIFLWSWLITMPISLVGGYIVYRAADRTYTYSVRFAGQAEELQFDRIARYEVNQLANFARVKSFEAFRKGASNLRSQILPNLSPTCRSPDLSTWQVGLFGMAN